MHFHHKNMVPLACLGLPLPSPGLPHAAGLGLPPGLVLVAASAPLPRLVGPAAGAAAAPAPAAAPASGSGAAPALCIHDGEKVLAFDLQLPAGPSHRAVGCGAAAGESGGGLAPAPDRGAFDGAGAAPRLRVAGVQWHPEAHDGTWALVEAFLAAG